MPKAEDFDLEGLKDFGPADFEKAVAYDPAGWQKDYALAGDFFDKLGDHLPKELRARLEKQKAAVK